MWSSLSAKDSILNVRPMNKLPASLFTLWLLAALTALPPLEGQSLSHRRVETGKKLFFDTRLSADHSISCATCHDPQRAFADDRPLSIGVFGRVGERHVPSLIARGAGTSQFWDGRTVALEKQVLEPITNPKEMDMTVAGVLARLRVDAGFAALTSNGRVSGCFGIKPGATSAIPENTSPMRIFTIPAWPGMAPGCLTQAGLRSPAGAIITEPSRHPLCAKSPIPRPTCTMAAWARLKT